MDGSQSHVCNLVQDQAARRVGEQAEQFFSRIKPFSLVARYMTPAHWWDGMNALFRLLAQLLQRETPQLLKTKTDSVALGIGEHFAQGPAGGC